jgi:hypothetical protein
MPDAARPARFDRLYDALKVLMVHESFTLVQIKEKLPHENPGYVTQLVHQLEKDGRLRHTPDFQFSPTTQLEIPPF